MAKISNAINVVNSLILVGRSPKMLAGGFATFPWFLQWSSSNEDDTSPAGWFYASGRRCHSACPTTHWHAEEHL
jgi:hypothetical protein